MMRTRTIQAAVVALVLAASAPIAHAGGGGAGSPVPGAMFDCYLISGDNPPQVLTMDDQFGERTGVKLGKARLLCTPAAGDRRRPGSCSRETSRRPTTSSATRPPGRANPKVKKQVVDPFVAETVKVGVPHVHLCPGLQVRRGGGLPPASVRLSRRSLLRSGVIALGVEPGGVLGPLWQRVQDLGACLVAEAHAAPPPSRLSDSELEDLIAFAELLVEGRALSPVERDSLVENIAERIAREQEYLGLYRTTVSLLQPAGRPPILEPRH